MAIVYASNGQKIGDGIRITRVSNGGQKLEVMTDSKAGTYSEVVLKADAPVDDEAGEEPGGSGGGGNPPPPPPDVDPPPPPDPVDPPPMPVVDFDLYVAPWGTDSNPGTAAAPLKTIPNVAGKRVGIAPGIYEQSIAGGAGATYEGWGGRPEITGGVAMTGGVPCDASDIPALGSLRPDVLKFTVPVADLPTQSPRAAIPTENGLPLRLASLKIANPKHPQSDVYPGDMLDGTPVLSGATIKGFSHPSLVGADSKIVLATLCEFIGNPNQNYQSAVASHDPVTGTIMLTGGAAYENSDIKDKFALLNYLPALQPGMWGYSVNGTVATIYVCPEGKGATYRRARLGNILRTAGAGVTFRNLNVTHSADFGPKQNKQNPVVIAHADCTVDGVTIFNVSRGYIKGYGAIYCSGSRPTIRDVLIYGARRTYGIFIQGTSPLQIDQPLIDEVTIRDVDGSPIQMFGCDNPVVANVVADECGMEAHGNALNTYEGCGHTLLFNVQFDGVYGYTTLQESGPHSFINCRLQVSNRGGTAGGRAVVDQNRGPLPTLTSAKGYMLQTTIYPYMPDVAKNNSLGLGRNGLPLNYEVWDSIYHGAVASVKTLVTGGNNVTTNGAPLLPGDKAMTLAEVYEDTLFFAQKDVGAGGDRSHILADLRPQFPRFDGWDAINWTATRIGAQ